MKLALITGASAGIGAAAARQLAADGYKVILVARRRAELAKVAADIGPHAIVEACDASDGSEVIDLADRVRRGHGVPDVIVHCAGAGPWKAIEDTNAAEAATMMRAPYLAAFNMSSAFMREMLLRRQGVIVHVNSPASICPWPASTGYAAARWALRGLHEALCQDLAGTGVHSCQIVFGEVASTYFEHNSVTDNQVPSISRFVPALSLLECGRTISRVARHPRRQTVRPHALRPLVVLHGVFPGFVRMLLRYRAGEKPKQSELPKRGR